MKTYKNINRYLLCCLILGLFAWTNQSMAQSSHFIGGGHSSQKAYEKAGAKAVKKRHYKEAIQHYRGAVSRDSSNIENHYQLGEASRKYGAYRIAKSAYEAVVVLDTLKNYPKAGLYLAQMEKRLGNYPQANSLISQLETMPSLPSIPNFQVLVTKERNDLDYIDDAGFTILNDLDNSNLKAGEYEVLCLPQGVNTKEFSEVSPFWYNERLYYSSLQFNKTDEKTGEEIIPFEKMAKTLHSDRLSPGEDWIGLNIDNKTTAHFTFTEEEDQMFFTICDYNEEYKMECEIYYRDKTNSGWSIPYPLPNDINRNGSTSTHPSVGLNEKGQPTLFYVSDWHEGNREDLDIWQVEILDRGEFGQPTKMDINTDEDDITPFFHFNTNSLYFSSEGHLSRGGFDVFRINRMENLNAWTSVQYLPEPINTGYNDFSYYLEPSGERGFMASNREGCEEGADGDLACYDIFQVNGCKKDNRFIVNLVDGETGEPVENMLMDERRDDMMLNLFIEGNQHIFNYTSEARLADLLSRTTFRAGGYEEIENIQLSEYPLASCNATEITIPLAKKCEPIYTLKIIDSNPYKEAAPTVEVTANIGDRTMVIPKDNDGLYRYIGTKGVSIYFEVKYDGEIQGQETSGEGCDTIPLVFEFPKTTCEPEYIVSVGRNSDIPLQSDLLTVMVSDIGVETHRLFPDEGDGRFRYKGRRESKPTFTVTYGDNYREVKEAASGSQCENIYLTFIVVPCETSVRIEVLDSLTNQPIIGAEVIIIDNETEHKRYIDSLGNPAVFTNIFVKETYLIIINADGYESQAIGCQPIQCVALKHKYLLIPNSPQPPPPPPSCTTTVAIQVFDSLTNEAIVGAEVIIIENGKEHKQFNEKGNEFTFTNIFEELEHLLIINKEGYQTKVVPCKPLRCGLLQAKIMLIPNESAVCRAGFNIQVFRETKERELLRNARVVLIENGREIELNPDATGSFLYQGKENNSYALYAEAEGYEPRLIEFTKEQLCGELNLELILQLKEEACQPELKLAIYEKGTKKRINNATVFFYELGAISRTAIGARNLSNNQQLTTFSNEYLFAVERGNAYMVIISPVNHYADTLIIEKADCINIDREVYLKPKTSSDFKGFLPLTCYFENDIPSREGGGVSETICNQSYSKFYEEYHTDENITTYQQKFGRNEVDKANRDALISNFFLVDVKGGYEKLNEFQGELLERLRAGQSFKLSIRGYASNLAASDYNRKLAHRRVWSIKNYFIQTHGLDFKPFINNGRLELVEIPVGEEVGQGFDDPNNKKDSVYNPISARQRKVIIERADEIRTFSSTNEEE